MQFRTGAFQAGAPVQPVLIEFAWRRHSPTWESIPVHVHLWRTLTQFTHHASVTYLPVYFPSVAERANPLLYAANVRKVRAHWSDRITANACEVMAEALRVPCAEVGRAEKSEYHSRITSGCAATWLLALTSAPASSTGGTGGTAPRSGQRCSVYRHT